MSNAERAAHGGRPVYDTAGDWSPKPAASEQLRVPLGVDLLGQLPLRLVDPLEVPVRADLLISFGISIVRSSRRGPLAASRPALKRCGRR